MCDHLVGLTRHNLAKILEDRWTEEQPAAKRTKRDDSCVTSKKSVEGVCWLAPMGRNHALGAAFYVYLQRPEAIHDAKDCEKMHCFEHPEQSECRGMCRRRAEIKRVEHVQLRASGAYRSPRHVDDFEIQRAIADRDKAPPLECTFRACKNAELRNLLKDYAMVESVGNFNRNAPDIGADESTLESNCGLEMGLLQFRLRRRRSKGELGPKAETSLNLDDFAPLCDEEIVRDTCRLLNEGYKHAEEIEEHLSSQGTDALDQFKGQMGQKAADGKVWVECMPLCHSIVSYLQTTAVCPPTSDVACYTVNGQTYCDVDVRPSQLKSLGPGSDQDLPDFGDKDSFLKTRGKNISQVPVETLTTPGEDMDSDTPKAAGIQYSFWEGLERLANLFRIYPEQGQQDLMRSESGSSLLETENHLGKMTKKEARLNRQKEEQAKAYMGLVIRAFSARQTQVHMTRWFGSDSFKNPAARKEVLRVLNSVDHMISNVHYVYPGMMCETNTFAYVYPRGGKCTASELGEYACRMTKDTNRFVFYLCPLYFKRPQEMVETLVHEGSHHATAYTDDVDFEGGKAYGRRTCKKLAKMEPLQALKNADNFCYYIQDVAVEVPDHPAAE
eukprot:symbB.v1.2.018225.t1/scaffold1448.1/size118061/1